MWPGKFLRPIPASCHSNSKYSGLQIEVDTGCRDIENGGLDPHVASAAAHLALHHIDWKTGRVGRENGKPTMLTQSGEDFPFLPHGADLNWATGRLYGRAQNFCRELKDTPASLMTPTIFADRVREELRDADNVVINVYDEDWARQKGMNTFLSVAAGTSEPAKFLEIIYNGSTTGTDIDVALVGKGVTFDSGGISLKSGETMKVSRLLRKDLALCRPVLRFCCTEDEGCGAACAANAHYALC